MYFLRVSVTFYDAVNVIHDVVKIANPIPYTAKFIEKIKLDKSDVER